MSNRTSSILHLDLVRIAMWFLEVLSLFGVLSLARAGRPNIIFIMADDLGYNDIGYHAHLHGSAMKTPNLDQLAAEGIKLENYYVQPICTPSRSQLMSGRYEIHTGLQHGVLDAGQRNALPLANKILPEQLRHCGFDTHMVGKWHLGYYSPEYMPQNRGFNSFFGYLNGAEDYYNHSLCNRPFTCGVDMRDTHEPLNTTWGDYSTFVFTEKAKEAIDSRDKSRPLFLYLAYQSVHFPMQVPESYMKPFWHIKDKTRRTYAGMLAALDEAVKNITDHLKRAGIFNNSIIIFSTDNGGHTAHGGNNWPLRGRKRTLWEGGVKGVGFISGKPLQMSNVTVRNFMHVSDWFPTILSAARCPKMPGTQPLDGFDQWKAILQREPSPRKELLHNIDPLKWKDEHKHEIIDGFDIATFAAIRSGPWKLLTGYPGFSEWVKPPESQNVSASSYTQTSKQETPDEADGVEMPRIPMLQLFHIETDPYERHELSKLYPTTVRGLLRRLAAYNATAVPVRFPHVDEKADPKYHGGFWGPWVHDRGKDFIPR